MSILLKIIIAVIIIVAATELSKRSTTLAAILLAMPIVLFVSFTLIWEESKDTQKIAILTHETLMFILPVLPFLFLLSYLLKNGINFYLSLGISSAGIILVTLLLQKYFFQS
ncbi:MAG: hypothetical protein P8K73_04605 [Methylophilaceae bacterium]|jgi:hypothetical protein|nr:hypothetical protein [Methylophilaceae bacterium]